MKEDSLKSGLNTNLKTKTVLRFYTSTTMIIIDVHHNVHFKYLQYVKSFEEYVQVLSSQSQGRLI